jgi:ribosomal protein S18 acetylase RimI-like enzyme
MSTENDAGSLSLRPMRLEDEAFFRDVYASTRADELAMTVWSAAQKRAFVDQQFAARKVSYAAQFPGAMHSVVEYDGCSIGYLIVDRGHEAWRLVDIALIPECRRKGFGTRLVRNVQREAAGSETPLRLAVWKSSPAMKLYERLGFRALVDRGLHMEMEWSDSFSDPA